MLHLGAFTLRRCQGESKLGSFTSEERQIKFSFASSDQEGCSDTKQTSIDMRKKCLLPVFEYSTGFTAIYFDTE